MIRFSRTPLVLIPVLALVAGCSGPMEQDAAATGTTGITIASSTDFQTIAVDPDGLSLVPASAAKTRPVMVPTRYRETVYRTPQ